jgi:hypothetical protein
VVAALVAALLASLTFMRGGRSAPSVRAARPTLPTLRFRQLPAVSDDGKLVAVAMRLADGARANDNLTLGIIDVGADRLVDRVVIVDAEDPDKPGRPAREAAAEALLAKRAWRPLRPLEMREDPGAPVRQGGAGGPVRARLAVGQGIRVSYREPVLTVREGPRSDRQTFRRAERGFSAPAGPRCKGCEDCPAPLASLVAANVDPATGILLLEIGYDGGTDVCWEPDQTFHVVRLEK